MANQKPLIALTPYFNIERDEPYMRPAYLKAIRAAGGTPLILPLDLEEDDLLQIVNTFDGFLFTGGPDIHPFYFGEETQAHCGNVCLRRDRMELTLLKLVMKARKPILGICRGIQVMNAALGGKIVYDIPGHRQKAPGNLPHHIVSVTPGSILHRTTGKLSLPVNSFHHQASAEPADGLIVSARSPARTTRVRAAAVKSTRSAATSSRTTRISK